MYNKQKEVKINAKHDWCICFKLSGKSQEERLPGHNGCQRWTNAIHEEKVEHSGQVLGPTVSLDCIQEMFMLGVVPVLEEKLKKGNGQAFPGHLRGVLPKQISLFSGSNLYELNCWAGESTWPGQYLIPVGPARALVRCNLASDTPSSSSHPMAPHPIGSDSSGRHAPISPLGSALVCMN